MLMSAIDSSRRRPVGYLSFVVRCEMTDPTRRMRPRRDPDHFGLPPISLVSHSSGLVDQLFFFNGYVNIGSRLDVEAVGGRVAVSERPNGPNTRPTLPRIARRPGSSP